MKNLNANKHIGKIFYEYRIKNKLTQNQVAELTDLEPRHISQLERGLTKGSIDTLIKLCNVYKITPDVVLYDLLNENVKKSFSSYEEKFKKLANSDKETILHLVDFFLSRWIKFKVLLDFKWFT